MIRRPPRSPLFPCPTLFRSGLVAGQVALAAVLLVGSGLLLRSFHRLSSVPLGFTPEGVLSLALNLPPARYPTDRKSTRLNSSHANISYAVFCLKKKKRSTFP